MVWYIISVLHLSSPLGLTLTIVRMMSAQGIITFECSSCHMLSHMQNHPRFSFQLQRYETKSRTGSLDTVINYPTDKYRKVLLTCIPDILYKKQYNSGPSNSRNQSHLMKSSIKQQEGMGYPISTHICFHTLYWK